MLGRRTALWFALRYLGASMSLPGAGVVSRPVGRLCLRWERLARREVGSAAWYDAADRACAAFRRRRARRESC